MFEEFIYLKYIYISGKIVLVLMTEFLSVRRYDIAVS